MAIPIKKFGQSVRLTIKSESDALVFETNDLRVDFEIFHLHGFSRAKIDIFNLDPSTVKKLSNGKVFASISTSLHDGKEQVIARDLFVSNALQEIILPEKKLSLYCYSGVYKKALQNQINIIVDKPSLENIISDCALAAKFDGVIEYKYFPGVKGTRVPPRLQSRQKGSFVNCLMRLSKQYNFNFYTEDEKLVIMYKPNSQDLEASGMFSNTQGGDILLDTNNMRQNPKIGPAQLQVTANLEPNIKPGVILDVSALLTAGTTVDQEVLEVAQGLLRDTVASFAKYQTLTVIHNGSNYTNKWQTRAMATSPTPGTNMSTNDNRWWI